MHACLGVCSWACSIWMYTVIGARPYTACACLCVLCTRHMHSLISAKEYVYLRVRVCLWILWLLVQSTVCMCVRARALANTVNVCNNCCKAMHACVLISQACLICYACIRFVLACTSTQRVRSVIHARQCVCLYQQGPQYLKYHVWFIVSCTRSTQAEILRGIHGYARLWHVCISHWSNLLFDNQLQHQQVPAPAPWQLVQVGKPQPASGKNGGINSMKFWKEWKSRQSPRIPQRIHAFPGLKLKEFSNPSNISNHPRI